MKISLITAFPPSEEPLNEYGYHLLARELQRDPYQRSLAEKMVRLLWDTQRQHEMAGRNFSAAVRMTMPGIIRQYLRSFERERKVLQWRPRSAAFQAPGCWSDAA